MAVSMSDIKVHTVFATITLPKDSDDTGTVCEGRYTVIDNVVTLTDHAGKPVLDQHGKKYTHQLKDGDDAKLFASRMTKALRLTLLGKDPDRVGARSELKYPKIGYA
jgi:hypothetical protein